MDFDLDLSDNEIYEEELTSSKVGNWYSWDEVNNGKLGYGERIHINM